MNTAIRRLWMPAIALLALTYLVIMLATGALPERRQLVEFEAAGVLRLAPELITRVTVSADGRATAFVRETDGWTREDSGAATEPRRAETIERAVRFMHTANPVRLLEPADLAGTSPAEFGLDPPGLSITLADANGVVLEADFGAENPDGLLQYMRLRGSAGLYLMSGFVGQEWEAIVKGGPGEEVPATRSLLPLALDDVAAVEIFARSKSYRFERDPTGAWLLHRHAPGDDPNMLHRADPAQSERIAQTLATFARTPIERSIARDELGDAYGLVDPETIIVLFTKDESRPPLSLTVGDLASGGLGRYLLMPDGQEIVTISEAQLSQLIDVAETLGP
jgi:Domain of unknown function (DUF4340)